MIILFFSKFLFFSAVIMPYSNATRICVHGWLVIWASHSSSVKSEEKKNILALFWHQFLCKSDTINKTMKKKSSRKIEGDSFWVTRNIFTSSFNSLIWHFIHIFIDCSWTIISAIYHFNCKQRKREKNQLPCP